MSEEDTAGVKATVVNHWLDFLHDLPLWGVH